MTRPEALRRLATLLRVEQALTWDRQDWAGTGWIRVERIELWERLRVMG